MAFNLVNEIPGAEIPGSPGRRRRRFYVPLASIPPGRDSVRAVDRSVFTIVPETYTPPFSTGNATTDIALDIRITPPAGGFTNEGTLPDPAMRLHSIEMAQVRFMKASGGRRDSLVLKLLTFGFAGAGGWLVPFPRWWRQWIEAGCIPATVIYENVDKAQLRTLLDTVAAPINELLESRVPATYGLSFPSGVTQLTKGAFIDEFLDGNGATGPFMVAEAGACIGTAAQDPVDPARRLLTLHAMYHDHTADNPHPMNPRELFHLLFGDPEAPEQDRSEEAVNHPLLAQIHATADTQDREPHTLRMFLRPPLRTSARVMWEGDLELKNAAGRWGKAGALGPERIYNYCPRANRAFRRDTYTNLWKCSLFAHDICVRSGFRACVHPTIEPIGWHYVTAASVANLAENAVGAADRVELMGRAPDHQHPWGFNVERWLRAQPLGSRKQAVNNAITVEGRCFLVAAARPCIFVQQQDLPGGIKGFADCSKSIRRNPEGHLLICREVRAEPLLETIAGNGLKEITCDTLEALGGGVVKGEAVKSQRLQPTTLFPSPYIRIHLVELHPGKDPDTVQGIRDLNVINMPIYMRGTQSERAAQIQLDRYADGSARPPGVCCQDNHPDSDTVSEIPCP